MKNLKLNIQVLAEALLLLTVTMGILAWFSHRALREEAMRDAEQTLEGTIQTIDNILLTVEQSAGNVYYDLRQHLDNPDRMFTYSQKLVESNPNIVGCAIVFKPGYYPGRDLFMAYVRRKTPDANDPSDLEMPETFADRPYTEQAWYTEPMTTGNIGWIDPLKGLDTEDEPLVTFCLPFSDKNKQRIGVIAVNVSINQLSKIILAAKPSPNGYSVLLAHNGSYIVHPDKEKLTDPTVFSQKERGVDESEIEAAKAMVAGERGMREFRRGNNDWCVFFKPFERVNWEQRTKSNIGWSVGVVYPEEDIFESHNSLIFLVVVIAIAGMLLFYLLCSWFIRRQMKPLKQLARSAQHIAGGNYREMLPGSDRQDEIGLLQYHFGQMQRSLQHQLDELEEETTQLRQHGDMLRTAHDRTVETDEMKTSFLLYMTNLMSESAESIDNSVTKLCNYCHHLSEKDRNHQVDNIQRKSQTVVELLKHMAHFTETDTGKEVAHDE